MENSKPIENLSRKERREFERQLRRENPEENKTKNKKIIRRILTTLVTVAIISGIIWIIVTPSRRPNLPPTVMQGHIEVNPKAHIITEPMPDPVQRHMIEHADGGGKPGIIIQYNCEKYDCESDLVTKLTDLVKQYPDNVYLAPNIYDGKIILTKMGESMILDTFDESKIKMFIEMIGSMENASSTMQ